MAKGIYRPAKYVHHIEEINAENIYRPEVTLNYDNLMAVCRECHDDFHDNHGRWAKVNERKRKAKRESDRFYIDEMGRAHAK